MTIKELREYLDREEDRMYLGEFGDVPLMTLHYKNGECLGVGPCMAVAAYEFGIVFVEA